MVKEKEFENKLGELGVFGNELVVGVYYYINKNGDVVLDEEEMAQDFETKLTNIKGLFK